MKSLVFSALLFFAVFASGQAITNHDVVHQDGAMAEVILDQSGSSVILNVSRQAADPGGNVQTFLLYNAFTSMPDGGFTDTIASGFIPSDTFRGDSAAHLTLNVDTSRVSAFSVTTCTFIFFPQFTETCAPGVLGVIQLDWTQSHNSTTHTVTIQQQVFNQARIETHQNSDTASAVVSGSFLGTAVNAGGQVGVNHGSTLELFRFH
jgi:hypothetical protein